MLSNRENVLELADTFLGYKIYIKIVQVFTYMANRFTFT